MPDEKPIVGRTKHGELTLDQLAELQPGLGTLMRDISDRYWILYYAAQGGNWDLAAYQLRGLRSLYKKGSTTRPKYAGMLADYAKKIFDPLQQHIEAKNFPEFAKVYQAGIDLANVLHGATKHGEIIWKLPPNPPPHLDLGPPPKS
ncbi:MAG: hypothetical protein PCFJNLEI_03107 [Verrucomicrobiae bacterium]|nr:hypothetical protein [Verrucomicrobiae bacterium]